MNNFQQIFNTANITGIKEIDDNLAAMVNGGNCPCSNEISMEANSAISLLDGQKTSEDFIRSGVSAKLIDNFSSKSLNEVRELAAEGCVEFNEIQTIGLENAIDTVEFNETVPKENPFEIAV